MPVVRERLEDEQGEAVELGGPYDAPGQATALNLSFDGSLGHVVRESAALYPDDGRVDEMHRTATLAERDDEAAGAGHVGRHWIGGI